MSVGGSSLPTVKFTAPDGFTYPGTKTDVASADDTLKKIEDAGYHCYAIKRGDEIEIRVRSWWGIVNLFSYLFSSSKPGEEYLFRDSKIREWLVKAKDDPAGLKKASDAFHNEIAEGLVRKFQKAPAEGYYNSIYFEVTPGVRQAFVRRIIADEVLRMKDPNELLQAFPKGSGAGMVADEVCSDFQLGAFDYFFQFLRLTVEQPNKEPTIAKGIFDHWVEVAANCKHAETSVKLFIQEFYAQVKAKYGDDVARQVLKQYIVHNFIALPHSGITFENDAQRNAWPAVSKELLTVLDPKDRDAQDMYGPKLDQILDNFLKPEVPKEADAKAANS